MSLPAIRDFINRHAASAAGLAALGAVLDARASGAPLPNELADRAHELFESLGAGDLFGELGPEAAAPLLAEIKQYLHVLAKLPYAATRGTSWGYVDPDLLQAFGDFARSHAHALTRGAIPRLGDLGSRLSSFLDVGVGAGGLATEMARLWPALRVVGIDVWQPSLALARENVERAGLANRIELREQSVATLEDEGAYDLVWMPMIFLAEQLLPEATRRVHRALRPGGWVVFAFANLVAGAPPTLAAWRMYTTLWGGPLWTPSQVETLVASCGFSEVVTLPSPPGVPVALVAGTRRD